MLERVDRVQLAVAEGNQTAEDFIRLLAAEPVGADTVAPLAAQRTTLRAGAAEIELLEPDGSGPVAEHLRRFGPGLFAAGFSTADLDALRARLVARGAVFAEAGGQLFLPPAASGGHGLCAVISAARAAESSASVGLITALYEVTNLVADNASVAAAYADVFRLDVARFCPIESAEYGYRGILAMFNPTDRLDRIECVTPYDLSKTMGRFMSKRGACLYMCFAEAPDLAAIRASLEEHAPDDWTGPTTAAAPDTLFIHPRALGGMLMGISRTSVGWTWSGHPERVRPAGIQPAP